MEILKQRLLVRGILVASDQELPDGARRLKLTLPDDTHLEVVLSRELLVGPRAAALAFTEELVEARSSRTRPKHGA